MSKRIAKHVSGLKIINRPIASLIPYVRNPRTHSDEQVAVIAASIREFGWTNPVLIDGEKGIIAGHGRVLAARKLGFKEVPCIELKNLTQAQRRAYVIADNQTALRAGWDDELLRLEVADLQGLDFDLSLLGFETDALDALLAPAGTQGLTDPDEVPDPPVNPVSRTGDLWVLGRHRLLCGDSTVADDVARVLGDVRPHLMVTDPPYGVEYDPDWRNRAKRAGSMQAYGASSTGRVVNDERADWREAWTLFPGGVIYVWHGALHATIVAESLVASDFEIRSQIIWAKQHAPISRGHYHWQHEPCWYAVRKGSTGAWAGDRKQTTLWQIANANAFGGQDKTNQTNHGTQKPVECMKRPIENNSSPGQAVYEPFSGSGTTIIAAEMTGRACHAIEINPVYIDVAIERWQKFTGQVATLDGKPWDEVQTERYDAVKDSKDGYTAGLDAVRDRVAAGGPGWDG
jgi:DNA modification methylase